MAGNNENTQKNVTTFEKGLIKGRVQGVFFRAETQKKARSLGVFGWVRNTDDGAVEVLLASNKLAVEFMKDWLRKGPELALVESAEFSPAEDPEMDDFEIYR